MMRTLLLAALLAARICDAQGAADRFGQLLRGGGALPSGFVVSAHSGVTGQAITATLGDQKSAKAAFLAAMRQISPYFDQRPVLKSAVGDARDQQIQAFFRASYQGAPVRGMIVITVQNGAANIAIFFDRDGLFGKSFAALARQASAAMPKAQPGAASGPPQLVRTRFPTGQVGLAPGWRIGDSYKGSVDLVGPHGEMMTLGYGSKVLPSMPLRGPYRPPWPAFQMYVNILNKGALSNGQMSMRLIEQAPEANPRGEGAWIAYEMNAQGKMRRGLAMVQTSRMQSDIGAWFFYCSMAGAPAEIFGRELPTMIAIWKSWGVSQAVFAERMDSVLRSMREINRMIQETNEYRQKTFDNTNYGWTETFRGVTMIENISTKARWEVNTDDAQWLVGELNSQGYNFRVVPTNELVWDLSNR